jgi:uncharacterized repeat protein (TIGR02543 family)
MAGITMELRRKIRIVVLSVLGCVPALLWMTPTAQAAEVSGKAVTISFDAKGGEAGMNEIQATYGSTYGELPEATKENYVFLGWYSYASGGTKVTENTKVIKPLEHTLYAHWRGEETELTLEPEGGTLSSNTVKVYFGSKYLKQLPVPTKENYKFDGWYTAAADGEKITANTIFTEKSPKTLYARWKEKSVRVSLIAFNGEIYEKEVFVGKEYGELPEPVKEKYIFGGWYKKADYKDYKAKEITAETIVNEAGLVKLFARWYIDKAASE